MSIFNNNKAGVLVDSLDNSSNNDSENPYSILLHDNSIPWAFSLMIMVRWAIGMVGMVLNGSLVYVTFKTGSLQSACNWLIAFNAACIACSMPFMSIGVLIVFSNIPDLIPIRTCFWLQMPSLICGNMFMSSMLAIGVDRLFSTLFVWHARLIDKKIYLCCILLLCLCHGLLFTILCYQGVISKTTNVVPCTSGGDVYQGYIGNTIFRVNFCIVSLCILCYLIIWITIRRNQTKWNGSFTQKILRSLLGMVLLISLGYMVSILLRIVAMSMDSVEVAYLSFGATIASIVAVACNMPLLYFLSYDYHSAYQKLFPRVFNAPPGSSSTGHNNQINCVTRVNPVA